MPIFNPGVTESKSKEVVKGLTYCSLNATQRATLLESGTYAGETVATNTIFETAPGKFENFVDNSTSTFSWGDVSSSTGKTYSDVTYGNGKFVAIGDSGIAVSTDGVNWSYNSSVPGDYYYYNIAFGNGKFVAISSDSRVYHATTSTDGVNWTTPETIPTGGSLYFYNGNFYISVYSSSSTTNWLYTSSDGITWSVVPQSSSYGSYTLAYDGTNFLAHIRSSSSENGTLKYSTDLSSWISLSVTAYSIAYKNGVYVRTVYIDNYSAVKVYYSLDMNTWTEATFTTTLSSNFRFGMVKTAGNYFYIMPEDRTAGGYFSSVDGITWDFLRIYPEPISSSTLAANSDSSVYVMSRAGSYASNVTLMKGSVTTTHNYSLSDLSYNKTQVDTALTGKLSANEAITGATKTKITYDTKGLVTGGADLTESDIPSLTLSKISDVSASSTELNYATGVTSNIQTQINAKVNTTDIVNNTASTDTNKPLSANMGKELNDRLNNVEARGRYLSQWNCSTGLPATNPTTSPYTYQRGDYYIIGTVAASGSTNYKPNGSTYTTDVPSTTVETNAVSVNDTYIYDGTTWILQINSQKEVSFSNLAGQPTDNTNLATALNAKQNTLTVGTGINITNDTISNTGLINTATGTNSLTVGGTANTNNYGTNVGIYSVAANNSVSVGHGASSSFCSTTVGSSSTVTGNISISIGFRARTSSSGSIMLGNGVNNEEKTFKVALNDTTTSKTVEGDGLYTLLKSDGTIPPARHATLPESDGEYYSKINIVSGVITQSWGTSSSQPSYDSTTQEVTF